MGREEEEKKQDGREESRKKDGRGYLTFKIAGIRLSSGM